MPGLRAPPILAAVRRGLRRYLGDLRASRAFLAGEVSHPGWLNLGQFRWRDVAPGQAARAAFGVLVPLAAGIATGHVEFGTFAALGAQPAGFVSFRGVTRSRVLLVAITAAGMAISTFVGGTTAASLPWVLVPVIIVWAYATGICSALGPTAVAVSLQWPVALLIGSAIPLAPSQALVRAGLVLAGGLWQGALVISSWALLRGSAERTAMAGSYAELSRYAGQLADGQSGPPAPDTLPGTAALRDPNPLLRSAARRHLLDLMEMAERIRTTLTTLAGPGGTTPAGSPAAARRALLEAASRSLRELAEALNSRPSRRAGHLELARQLILADILAPDNPRRWAGETLHGQLRSACDITERLNDAEPGRSDRAAPRPSVRLPAHDLAVTLRANLGVSSQAGRHALRLAVVAGLAEVVAQAAGLSHGYWAGLTVLLVLRPDYGSTLYRGLQRAAGTVLGAGLGVATVLLGHFGSGALLAGIGLCLFASYAMFPVSYLAYAVFLTEFVVVLLSLLGLPADQTALARLVGTGIGTGLALLAYILWPTWEGTAANEKFALVFLAQARFADALLRAYARPTADDARRARPLKLAARRARADAEASADRLADEPDRPPMTGEFAQALVSAGHRLALAVLLLEAAVDEHHAALRRASELVAAGPGRDAGEPSAAEPDPLQPQLDRLAGMVRQASAQLAESLRRLGPPAPLPPLREVQTAIPQDTAGGPSGLFSATDSLVDALNTAAGVLRRYLAPQAGDSLPGARP
jgi:uncharacterized membrane protein YccC